MAAAMQLRRPGSCGPYTHFLCPSPSLSSTARLVFPYEPCLKSIGTSGTLVSMGVVAAKASSSNVVGDDAEDGVSLGTVKLPANTDLARFEILLFQWANSLCQGANLPLPSPLKVDRVKGGARLGFTTVGDEKTDVSVYIDCLVFPAADGSGPIFRAIRNGLLKDKPPPGEPRIMRSLLQALQKSIEIARI